ncbi:integral membrane protein [Diaminobutyricimonas aerilata]|uniref:Integral membrane protein n=1 Tax=Diaminobutyricimonas aerilata TaxID=1162967 RepID=A0A2M9CGD7_9MICO|nr:DUF3817 domain-containing protein [Diaminobutyricimonas aerilata]PJJ70949.1 integral membrane protein [Diaminobutyricimonas aerilata]
MSPRALFRTFAIAEAVTWALLIAGMLQKYVFHGGGWGVSIGGALHGFVFLGFAAVVLLVALNQRWSVGLTLLAWASAVVPFASIPAEIALDRSGRLAGGWRREATADPRDAHPLDRWLRWWLNRPVLLAVVLGAVLVAVFVALLIGGPPGTE